MKNGGLDKELDIYWLAGLLEGEGSFLKGPPSKRSAIAVRLAMTDPDVVARVAELFDRSMCRSDRGVEFGLRPVFITALKGAAAARLMRALHPVMGHRRRAQIERALSGPHRTAIRWKRPSKECSVAACIDPGKVKGLCRRHYRSWGRRRTGAAKARICPGRHLRPPL